VGSAAAADAESACPALPIKRESQPQQRRPSVSLHQLVVALQGPTPGPHGKGKPPTPACSDSPKVINLGESFAAAVVFFHILS
jgi:hypothetical protein